jgi:adenine-specific DNA-methyltransferase
MLRFAHCFQTAKIGIDNMSHIYNISLDDICDEMNSLQGCDGWFTQYYSVERQYFSLENARKLQACINIIWKWHDDGLISEIEYSLLIASLINSMDSVANTAGTYYAHLKTFSRKANNRFKYKMLAPVITNTRGRAHLSDAIDLVAKTSCDILYLDPPYNGRDYASYYHLPETIARKIIPDPQGKSGVHHHKYRRSFFSSKNTACSAFEQVIHKSNCKLLIFHYSDTGVIPSMFIDSALKSLGEVHDVICYAKGYSTNESNSSSKHHVYWVYRQ